MSLLVKVEPAGSLYGLECSWDYCSAWPLLLPVSVWHVASSALRGGMYVGAYIGHACNTLTGRDVCIGVPHVLGII